MTWFAVYGLVAPKDRKYRCPIISTSTITLSSCHRLYAAQLWNLLPINLRQSGTIEAFVKDIPV